VLGFADRYQ